MNGLAIPEKALDEFGKHCTEDFTTEQLRSFLKTKNIDLFVIPHILKRRLQYKIRITHLTEAYCEYMMSDNKWLQLWWTGVWTQNNLMNENLFDTEELALHCGFQAALILLENNELKN